MFEMAKRLKSETNARKPSSQLGKGMPEFAKDVRDSARARPSWGESEPLSRWNIIYVCEKKDMSICWLETPYYA